MHGHWSYEQASYIYGSEKRGRRKASNFEMKAMTSTNNQSNKMKHVKMYDFPL